MTTRRYLIVNADDFGQSPGVNRGVIRAHEHGIVTSASLMVRWPAALEAAASAQRHPELSVGLHFDLGEWTYRDGAWTPRYVVVSTEDINAVKQEAWRQLNDFRRIMAQNPTHIDSHQHVHRSGPASSVLVDMARQLSVPLRHYTPQVRYCGYFYGQTGKGLPLPEAITAESLIKVLATLEPGVTELGCHPGDGDEPNSMYGKERAAEAEVLCDPRVRAAITGQGIELSSFSHAVARRKE